MARRSAAEDSPSRTALLDAAEALMIEEGYASVTTRRLADRAGVNNGLVHYYFGSMDEMFIELFRRATRRGIEPTLDPAGSDQPLWEMWERIRDFSGNALMTEFIALANHRDAIREEIREYSDTSRRAQIEGLTRLLAGYDVGGDHMSPAAAALFMVGMSRFLQMEEAFGIDVGHADAIDAIEERIRALEGERRR